MIFDFSPPTTPPPEPQLSPEEALKAANNYLDQRIKEAASDALYKEDCNTMSILIRTVCDEIKRILGSSSDSPRTRILRLDEIIDTCDVPRGHITARNVQNYKAVLEAIQKVLQPTVPPSPQIHRKK